MSDFKGRFVWHELTSPNAAAVKPFYETVVGWTTEDIPMPGMTYTLAKASDVRVAGMMDQPPGAGAAWTGYIAVDDVDASAKQAEGLGGKVHRAPEDIPGVGRFAILRDPFGAFFALFTPGPGEPPPELAPGSQGLFGWNELYTDDVDKGFAFYEAMFGWRKDEAIPMGEMGVYQLFAVGDLVIGGMMKRPEQIPSSGWLYYINVGDIDAASRRVTGNKGFIANGPMEVPGGDWVLQAVDPQGVMFALVGKRTN